MVVKESSPESPRGNGSYSYSFSLRTLGVSPLVGLRDHGFVAGQAITKAEAGKVAKHEKACIENQHVFVPFAFDTFGALAPDAVRFRVQQVVSSNVKGQNFVFSRVGFAIQNGVGAAC
ncbi:putative exostosin [Helianthus anomalus]